MKIAWHNGRHLHWQMCRGRAHQTNDLADGAGSSAPYSEAMRQASRPCQRDCLINPNGVKPNIRLLLLKGNHVFKVSFPTERTRHVSFPLLCRQRFWCNPLTWELGTSGKTLHYCHAVVLPEHLGALL